MPVIVEPDDVQPALRGLINEMSRRYKLMEEMGVRNIAGYNAKANEPMCFLVLIVDELADLMMTGGLEVEQQLVRLAQLGRAAGIHMVLATQRPSVKVVTGLLKANVPARGRVCGGIPGRLQGNPRRRRRRSIDGQRRFAAAQQRLPQGAPGARARWCTTTKWTGW